MRLRRTGTHVMALLGIALVGAAADGARANVGVLPIAVGPVEGGRGPELQSALEVELADVLKRRLVKVAPGRSCTASFGEECVLEVMGASKTPLDEVALVGVEGTPSGGYLVDISVRETGEGRRVFHERVVQQPSDGPGVIGAALRRAFEPRAWAGRIVVEGAPADAEVIIDGLRVTGPTVARVGAHDVEVRTADGALHTFQVAVRDGEVSTVPFTLPPTATGPSLLPALFLGGVTVAGTGAAAAFGGLAGWYCCWDSVEVATDDGPVRRNRYEFTTFNARTGGTRADRDPISRDWESGYGTTSQGDVTDSARLAQRALAHADLAADQALMVSYGFVAVVSVAVAVGAGVGAFLAWPSQPDETGDPASAP